MSMHTTVTVKRNGSPVSGLSAVPVQIDKLSAYEKSLLTGQLNVDYYEVYVLLVCDIRRGDELVDNIPTSYTHNALTYRIAEIPEVFETDHMECIGSVARTGANA